MFQMFSLETAAWKNPQKLQNNNNKKKVISLKPLFCFVLFHISAQNAPSEVS